VELENNTSVSLSEFTSRLFFLKHMLYILHISHKTYAKRKKIKQTSKKENDRVIDNVIFFPMSRGDLG
jgi:hypothetical protein